MLERLRRTTTIERLQAFGVLVAIAVAVPLVVSGPGNDLDVANTFRSGRSIALHLSYVPSRPPGAPVHELIVGIFDLLGGPLLTNLASVLAAGALLVGLDRLLRRDGITRGGRWAVALVAACPWFVIAATSTTEYVFALAFVVAAALALRSGRPVVAGLLAAASMACRVGSGMLVLALLLAELTEPAPAGACEPGPGAAPPPGPGSPASTVLPTEAAAVGVHEGHRLTPELDAVADHAQVVAAEAVHGTIVNAAHRRTAAERRAAVAVTAVVAAAGTVVAFVPAYLSAHGLSFADNDFSNAGLANQLGRAFAKDLNLLGVPALVLALLALPATWAALRRWRTSWIVRFAVVGFVTSQVLFIRFPWKMEHLLPCLVCLALLLGVALDRKPRLLAGLVALQLAFCVVRVNVVQPNDPNQATSGKVGVSTGWGPVVTDWQCRREHRDAYRGRQKVEVEAAWDCDAPFGR